MNAILRRGFDIAKSTIKSKGDLFTERHYRLAPYGPRIRAAGQASANHPLFWFNLGGDDPNQFPTVLRVIAKDATAPDSSYAQQGPDATFVRSAAWQGITGDLTGMSPGPKNLKLRAVNAWGETDSGQSIDYVVT